MATFTIQTWNSEFSAWRVPTRGADFSTLDDATKRGRQFREGSVYRVLDPEGNIAFLRDQDKIV